MTIGWSIFIIVLVLVNARRQRDDCRVITREDRVYERHCETGTITVSEEAGKDPVEVQCRHRKPMA